jgi:asparagine synthase (glutamine-hydrolysing)
MCGVAGIYAYLSSASSVDRRELLAVRDRMATRGPDDAGIWIGTGERIALAHRRLTIIDLSASGAQPMSDSTGRHIITFNGEIYNYKYLREKLIADGFNFQSNCDTEVLINLYAQKGARMVEDLRGMFAFAIWDNVANTLFLARDPYGIKPLYYSNSAGTFRFASSVKALLAGGELSREIDPAGEAGFYLTGSVPEPFTIYRAIRALPAGSWMEVSGAGISEPQTYFSVARVYQDAENETEPLTLDEMQERVRAALLDSVRHHLVSDVPVGAFLSSGVDSGALVGLMRDAGAARFQTLTLGFEEFYGSREDEGPLAAEVARRYGAEHSVRIITGGEFRRDVPSIVEAMDQPSVDGINSWFVSKAARELGLKVMISGLGGDELFGGYPSFTDIPRWRRRVSLATRLPGLGVGLRQLARIALGRNTSISPKAFSLVEFGGTIAGAYLLRRAVFMPWELAEIMGEDAAREALLELDPVGHGEAQLGPSLKSDFAKIATLESTLYLRNQLLRDTDWASMAHSLEVRVPLVDSTLLSTIAPIALQLGPERGKSLLAGAPQRPLPGEVVNRTKTGFGMPIGSWSDTSKTQKGSSFAYVRDWARSIGSANFPSRAS